MTIIQNITIKAHQYSFIALQKIAITLKTIDSHFQNIFQSFNFTLFCIIYSIIFIYFLHRWNKNKFYYRPQNIQLQTFKQKALRKIKKFVFNLPILKQLTQRQLHNGVNKMLKQLMQQNEKNRDPRKANVIPSHGMTQDNIKKRIQQWYQSQVKIWDTGKISGAFYTTQKQHFKELTDFASKYMYHNPMHLDSYPEVIKMESEVLKMTGSLLSKEGKTPTYGVITSGGTQSLMMAIYAYKKYYSHKTKPNIVIPNTAHVAFDKGCFYFNVQCRKAKLDDNFQVDLKHMQSLIDDQTIMIMGSAPNYPHGIVDPLNEIGKLGKKYNCGVHVDACLGGFIVGFSKQYQDLINIQREGVTSVSLDHHKFALAPKGISTIFYRTSQLRRCHYYSNTQWTGGLYGTFSMAGSRSGFASAGAWYSLTHIGKNGFKENSQRIIESTKSLAKKLNQTKGVKVFGNPSICVVGFTTTQISIQLVYSYLTKQKHWDISLIQKPMGIHVSITLANMENTVKYLKKDIEEAFEVISKKGYKMSFGAALYGVTAKIPTQGLSQQAVNAFISATLM